MAVYTSESSAGTVGLAAAAGGLSAVFADLIQKGDASAVFELTANVNKLGDLLYPPNLGTWPGVPVAGVGLGLLLVSIILAFMSEARSRTSAFYSGASVLTVLMTLVPYTQALPAPSDMTVNKSAMLREDSMIVPATYQMDGFAPVWRVQATTDTPVTIVVHAPNRGPASAPNRINGQLYDRVSGKTWQFGFSDASSSSSGSETIYTFNLSIPTSPQTTSGGLVADLSIRIDVPGYQTTTATQKVGRIGAPVTMEVTLQPSALPGFLKRALEAPRF